MLLLHNDMMAWFFLHFGHWSWMVGITFTLILARKYLNRCWCLDIHTSFWYSLLFLCTFSIVVNVALKAMFKVPLQPPLIGYALPSGHMQLATVFYGYLVFMVRKRSFLFVIGILLIGLGQGLTYYHFHTWLEVSAGFFVGCVLLLYYTSCKLGDKKTASLMWGIACILMVYNKMNYQPMPRHAIISFFILTSLVGYTLWKSTSSSSINIVDRFYRH